MVLADLIYAAGSPAGWALLEDATDKERRFLKKHDIEVIDADFPALIAEATASSVASAR
jgi:hypothetical protein